MINISPETCLTFIFFCLLKAYKKVPLSLGYCEYSIIFITSLLRQKKVLLPLLSVIEVEYLLMEMTLFVIGKVINHLKGMVITQDLIILPAELHKLVNLLGTCSTFVTEMRVFSVEIALSIRH